jgi:hypothetical protein
VTSRNSPAFKPYLVSPRYSVNVSIVSGVASSLSDSSRGLNMAESGDDDLCTV